MKLQVLNKISTGAELAYCLDSAKPREADNVIPLDVVKSTLDLKEGQVVECKATELEPVMIGKKYGIKIKDLEIVKISDSKYPDNARELLREAQQTEILKSDEQTLTILKALKILKNVQELPQPTLNATGNIEKGDKFEKLVHLIKDESKHLVYGVVYEPWDGRNLDSHGDYATDIEIEKAAHTYLSKFSEISLMHQKRINKDAEVVESFIAPVDYQINGEQVKKGSWVLVTHIRNDELWNAIEKKDIEAYSIEGTGRRGPDIRKSADSEEVRKGNLIDMTIEAVALVKKGANKKKFYLLKSEEGITMDKELALLLLKDIQNPDLRERILKSLSEADKVEVEKAFPPAAEKKLTPEEQAAEDAKKKKPKAEVEMSAETIDKIVAKVLEKIKGCNDGKDIKKYIEDENLEIPEELVGAVLEQLKVKE